MAASFVNKHSIMDTPHFSGDAVHGARNRNVHFAKAVLYSCSHSYHKCGAVLKSVVLFHPWE